MALSVMSISLPPNMRVGGTISSNGFDLWESITLLCWQQKTKRNPKDGRGERSPLTGGEGRDFFPTEYK